MATSPETGTLDRLLQKSDILCNTGPGFCDPRFNRYFPSNSMKLGLVFVGILWKNQDSHVMYR